MTAPSPIGYVVLNFPKLSETFVVDELLALERLQVFPRIYARDELDEAVSNPRAAGLIRRATWLSAERRTVQLVAALRTAVGRPRRLARCLSVALRTRSRWTFVNLRYAIVLANRCERDGIRYLHAHFAGDAGEVAYFAAELAGIPFGMTIHGVDIYLNRFLCRKLDSAALLVTVCEYNVRQLVERCPERGPSDYLVKYAGIDPTAFTPSAPRQSRPGRRVIAVGRLTTKKGFDLLLRAVSTLAARGRPIECVIVGQGGIESDLRALAAELGVDVFVRFAGSLSPEQIKHELEDADVLAAPCTIAPWGDRDSMPVVVKEALAMELPVVATDDFGIPEMVDDRVGVLVPRDDVDALADALDDVLSRSPEERAEMGRRGRQVICERFDEANLVQPLAQRFAELTTG